jgi:lysophospholipase L1-like esterase
MDSTKKLCLVLFLLINSLCHAQKADLEKTFYTKNGRIEILEDNKILLIGSASSVSLNFKGNFCTISLQSIDTWEHHNYVSLELDGEYIGRLKIEKGPMQLFPIVVPKKKKIHTLTIYKATEASNGSVLFGGAKSKLCTITSKKKKKIEFIGDSITCGMGNDITTTPCGSGEWFDQHNAYMSYGSVLSNTLSIDFILSSVSGIGMYRNWNDEHENESIMPDIYENLYLNNTQNNKKFDTAFQPDIVSICLGTNDLSDGDGIKERLPFNDEKFIFNYVQFIKLLYSRNPNTRIVLLNSPMVSGDKNSTLISCLKKVMGVFENDKNHKPIELFEFQSIIPKGCGFHPDIYDHKNMAYQLTPLFKKLLDEK